MSIFSRTNDSDRGFFSRFGRGGGGGGGDPNGATDAKSPWSEESDYYGDDNNQPRTMDENVFTGDVKQDRETLQRDGINQYTDNTTTETEDDDGAGSVDSYKNRRNGNLDDTARAGSRHSLAGSRGGGG